VLRDLVFDDELHGDFVSFKSMVCRHDKTVAPRANFSVELVIVDEIGVKLVTRWKP
jgi:hypothetical protein